MDDRARLALNAIEQNLAREDPAFVARMRAERPPAPRFPVISVLCASLYIAFPIAALLFGRSVALIIADVFAIAIAAVALCRRR
jgi:DUF3040 family protein